MEPLPLSLLNDFLFCNRRAALKVVEGLWGENAHTLIGDLAHEHADLPGYEVAKGVTLLRALPVWSERLGLSGKCDIVERHADGAFVPVEYKKGKRRQFENDDVQLCAQALCLEEVFGCGIGRGAIFHAASKRRREVEFSGELRVLTEEAAAELHALAASGFVPQAVLKPQCSECSLYELCLPQLTCHPPGPDLARRNNANGRPAFRRGARIETMRHLGACGPQSRLTRTGIVADRAYCNSFSIRMIRVLVCSN